MESNHHNRMGRTGTYGIAMSRKRLLSPHVILPWSFGTAVPRIVRCFHCSRVRLEVWVLLEMSHILSSMTTLQKGIRCFTLFPAFPKHVFAQRFGELVSQHVPTRSAR